MVRPYDGTSGLVRGSRRKAVFAFKGYLLRWFLIALSALRRLVLSRIPEVLGKIENLRAQPDYLQQNRRSRKSKTGGLVGRSRFYPALPKAPARSMRQIPESPSTPPFQVKKQQVEALPLSSAVVMSGICRILPDLAQARRGCISIEAVESSLYLVICI